MWRIFVSKIKAMDNTFEKTVNYSVPNSDIKIINYSPVSIALIGYTKHIKKEIDFNVIKYCNTSFIDEQLKLSQSDVLFKTKIPLDSRCDWPSGLFKI